jgi:hypothetical protein
VNLIKQKVLLVKNLMGLLQIVQEALQKQLGMMIIFPIILLELIIEGFFLVIEEMVGYTMMNLKETKMDLLILQINILENCLRKNGNDITELLS